MHETKIRGNVTQIDFVIYDPKNWISIENYGSGQFQRDPKPCLTLMTGEKLNLIKCSQFPQV